MTEVRVATLLICLRDYYRKHKDILPDPVGLSVAELAGDLIDLLPPGCDHIPGLEILDPRPLLHRPGPPKPIPGQVDLEGNEAA